MRTILSLYWLFGFFLEQFLELRFLYQFFKKLLICLFNIFFERIYINLVPLIFSIIYGFLSYFLLKSMIIFLFNLSSLKFLVKICNFIWVHGHRFRFSSVLHLFNIWDRLFSWLYRSQTLQVTFNVVYEFAFMFRVLTFFVILLYFCLENGVFNKLFSLFFWVFWWGHKLKLVRFLLFLLYYIKIIFCLLLRFRLNFYNTRF